MLEHNQTIKDRHQQLSSAKKSLLEKWLIGKTVTTVIPKRGDPQFAPLSLAQQRLWLVDQLVPGSPLYNMHDAVHIKGKMNIDVLKKALTTLVNRHEILRTSIVIIDEAPYQKIVEPHNFELAVEDVRYLEPELRSKRAYEIVAAETKRPFDLKECSLFRAKLVRINEEEQLLVWTMHHIIADGWSLGIIIKEILALCTAYNGGQSNPLSPLPIQYGDFAFWQQSNHEANLSQLSYWKEQLKNCNPFLELPADKPRPSVTTYCGKRKSALYAPEKIKSLKDFAHQQGATLFMVLLAAFDVLLYRYSGMNDICVGVPVANRNKEELHSLIGYFSNTVVMRCDLEGNPSFNALLSQVKEITLAAYANQDISFEKLVEELQPVRSMSYSPLFQVMLVLQNEPMPVVEQEGVTITPIDIHNGTSKFDLLLNVVETNDGLSLSLEYNSDIFIEDTITKFLEHYQILLSNAVENPSQLVETIPLISEKVKQQLLIEWNNTTMNFGNKSNLLHELFEEQVNQNPRSLALSYGTQALSYQELNEKANQLAHHLIEQGVKTHSIVAVYLERSFELVIALTAILKTGASFLPLDPDYPMQRLSIMLEDSQCNYLIIDKHCPFQSDSRNINIVNLSENVLITEKTNPEILISAEASAYTIYTSGSTGKPKGASNTHAGICNRLLWMQHQYQLQSTDKILQKTPISFDVSVWELFWPLIAGAHLVLAPPKAQRDTTELSKLIQQHGITTVHFVPSQLKLFLQDQHSLTCVTLQRVMCSGEALTKPLVEEFQAKFNCELHNLYGPTEAAIDVTFWNCAEKIDLPIVPIGRPIANTQIYILDQHLNPTPIGVPGELYIGGVGVGSGYLNNELLSRKSFIKNPFSENASHKLYKTGDLARYLKNGIIEFLGRIDAQRKFHGVRIEPQEIESVLMNEPSIAQAAVAVKEINSNDQRLVAYIVVSDQDQTLSHNSNQRIEEWRYVFDKAYTDSSSDAKQNFASWNSSYTHQTIPKIEMEEWLEVTLARIREKKPRKILEIGCGTGLLLFQLVNDCDLYIATDISNAALDHIRTHISPELIDTGRCQLLENPAHDISGFEHHQFDMIILNSVVQYFPSGEYLLHVLNQLSQLLCDKGHVFLGDIRNLALSETFYCGVELFGDTEGITISELDKRIQSRKNRDNELLVDPKLFSALPNQQFYSEVLLRRGKFQNEMTVYRYDVILSKKCDVNSRQSEFEVLSWKDLTVLSSRLAAGLQRPLHVCDIPNARIQKDNYLASTLKQLDPVADVHESVSALLSIYKNSGIDPESLWDEWAKSYNVKITYAGNGNRTCFDVFIFPKDYEVALIKNIIPVEITDGNYDQYFNIPRDIDNENDYVKRLKENLKLKLPEYWIPSQFVVLEKLPLLPNGKLDRKNLPLPKNSVQSNKEIKPNTTLEVKIAALWCEILSIQETTMEDDFFDLGGNSLLAARLLLRLREQTNMDLPLRIFFQSPTLSGILNYFHNAESVLTEKTKETWARMQQECYLPASIIIDQAAAPLTVTPTLLLTGATGFLGCYLLKDLLAHSQAKIICLIRSSNENEGREKLVNTLKFYHLLAEIDWSRITILCGDLTKTNLGIPYESYLALAQNVESIYHCGAHVNFMYSYDHLYQANVGGTLEILRLATLHHTKQVHYISTIHTLVNADKGSEERISEWHSPQHGEEMQMGYLQTKWVAERLALSARERGIPVTIYRPGRISGDIKSGVCQENDFFWGLIRVCLVLGVAPQLGLEEMMLPVDYVSESIVRLSLENRNENQNYHLISQSPLNTEELFSILNSHGYTIKRIPFESWKQYARRKAQASSIQPSTAFAGFLFMNNDTVDVQFSNTITETLLKEIPIQTNPNLSSNVITSYIRNFIHDGFFPEPSSYEEVVS